MMAKLDLRTVTLVAVETRAHELMRMAIDDCLALADFGGILICSDNFKHLNVLGADLVQVKDWPEKVGWSRYFWQGVGQHVHTPYTLNIQWDSWIWCPAMWFPEYLDYDYIGAPWWHEDGLNVGNGGFCIRSKRLLDYMARHSETFPITTSNDDALVCRTYRRKLEQEGFRWAPEGLAFQFSLECPRDVLINNELKTSIPLPDLPHFGFHGMHAWPFVLNENALVKRTLLALSNKYIRNTRMPGQLFNMAPWLAPLVGAELAS
jgi:hypothetical protein